MGDDGSGHITDDQIRELQAITICVNKFMRKIREQTALDANFVAGVNSAVAEFWSNFVPDIVNSDLYDFAWAQNVLPTMNQGKCDETVVRALNNLLALTRKYKLAFSDQGDFEIQVVQFENMLDAFKQAHNSKPKFPDRMGNRLVASIMEALYE
jgi:hypothetical protein